MQAFDGQQPTRGIGETSLNRVIETPTDRFPDSGGIALPQRDGGGFRLWLGMTGGCP